MQRISVMRREDLTLTRSLFVIFILTILAHKPTFATETMYCYWHCAYFDVLFIGNYGGDDRGERCTQDVVQRTNVAIQLDNLLRTRRREGKLERFTRWILVDDYTKSYNYVNGRREPGKVRVDEKSVFLCLTDSVSLNRLLQRIWDVSDTVISPSTESGMWLFSLHVGLSKTRLHARPFHYGGYVNERPDTAFLWLRCEYSEIPHHWYQHETDGYYHQYTGLYLTHQNVVDAQELLKKHCNLNTNIVSHYVTPAIITRYAGWNF